MIAGAEIQPGTTLDGRYRIKRRVGSGGFGTVFEGEHLTLGVSVAIKIFLVGLDLPGTSRDAHIEALTTEARLLTKLRHDNVVRTFDQGSYVDDASGISLPYVVMEWCGDETLDRWLSRQTSQPLPFARIVPIFSGIVAGVAHAHAEGIAHRDLKPSNVMMVTAKDGVVSPRVIDFGIAKAFERNAEAGSGDTRTTGPVAYTPAYAAPEQAVGARTGPWTDVHALGLMLVELVTGIPPYGESGSVPLAIIDPVRPSPRARGIDVGPLEPVIARALALRPQDRYRDAGELRAAFEAAVASPELSATVLATPTEQARIGAGPSRLPLALESTTTAGSSTPPRDGMTTIRKARASLAPVLGGAVLLALGVAGGIAFTLHRSAANVDADEEPSTSPRRSASAMPSSSTSASAAPSSSAPSPPKGPPRLATMTAGEVANRMQHAALVPVVSPDPHAPTEQLMLGFYAGNSSGAVYLNHVAIPEAVPKAGAALVSLRTVRSWMELDKQQGFGLVYGIQGDWVFSMSWTPVPDGRGIEEFDALTEGIDFDIRGTSFSGPNPAVEPGASKKLWFAKKMGELSDVELAYRVEATGTSVKANLQGSEWALSLSRGAERGELHVFPPGSQRDAAVETFTKAARGRRVHYALAQDELATIVATGAGTFGSKAFLEEVLGGLSAEVRTEP